ncbi:hypothetical protein [Pelomonas sp. Root1444]|uniref:hypothetical protein n=1 Tax=Pelomonas sp. Root1444 TaxID=1736464 RepID=UPI0007029DA8|nr:hypothetical protein [Pelomonas sp. Root1444]KQY83727.1 hypothetical protein ASD35_24200 [Pelomonas sp. Root1444]
MPRQRLTRDQLLARAQRTFPVRMTKRDLVHVGIAHIDTLNDIATGRGTFASLRDWASNVLTWYRAAQLMSIGIDEMAEQRECCARLVERFERTGRVAFDGPDYQLAKHGVDVMDELARRVPRAIALEAVAWSTAALIELYGPAYTQSA